MKQKWEEKQLYWNFKLQTSEISHEKTWTWLRKGNLKRETESLLIAAQNKAIRIMSKEEYTRRNKIADWVGKVTHWELWKKFEFD